MPVTDSSKKILELASQLIGLQQDLELAKALNTTEDISSILNKIKQLEEANASIWEEVKREIARLELETKFILQKINLEEQALAQYKAGQQAVSPADIDSLRREAAYNLVQHLAENRKKQAVEAKRLGKRAQPFDPLLKASYRNYLGSFSYYGDTRKEAFANYPDIKELKQALESNESLAQLKERILNLINHRKEFKKTVEKDRFSINPIGRLLDEWSDPTANDPKKSLSNNLNKVKKNINLELYPTFGKQIDALENYIQNLKETGVDPKQSKQVILKSDRSKKYRIAEKLKNELINFEAKSEVDRKTDSNITITAIENLIKENEEATGSLYLHGKGKLDKILKDIKDEIDFSIHKNYTEKSKATHLKSLQKMSLKEAMASGSGHFFRDEIVALTELINRSHFTWEHQKNLGFHRDMSVYNPKEEIKIEKKLRTLLLNSHDLSNEKLEILKSRIGADIAASPTYGSGKALRQILEKLNTKIDNPKKLRP